MLLHGIYWDDVSILKKLKIFMPEIIFLGCVNISDISWLQRKVAATLFATPPEATIEEAIDFFLRAETLSPGFWKKNAVMLAECYVRMGNKEEALKWLEIGLELPILTDEDSKAHKQGIQLKKKI